MLTPPRRRWTRSQMVDIGPIHLTPQGIKRLQDRLARLKRELPAFIEETQRTAAYGDRSDSAEYKEAKSNLRRTNRQIFSIEDQLKRVVEYPEGNVSGTVQLGCTVVLELQDLDNNKKDPENIPDLGSCGDRPWTRADLSYIPARRGAFGSLRSVGETVKIETPKGSQEYKILEIK